MAVEIKSPKSIKKHALFASMFGVILFFGISFMFVSKPGFTERATEAFFIRAGHIVPGKNGLATVKFNNDSRSVNGLGETTAAGDRMHSQMNLISSSEASK